MMRAITSYSVAVFLAVAMPALARSGGDTTRIGATISYISGMTVYVGAGRERGLAAGDTAQILGPAGIKGRVIIGAVSATSASGQLTDSVASVGIGDSIIVEKWLPGPALPTAVNRSAQGRTSALLEQGFAAHGRIAAQLSAARALNGGWDLFQPALLMRLDLSRILGTELAFSFYGRGYRDLASSASRFSNGQQTTLRLYDASLRYDSPASRFGFAVGRLTSRLVGGLGAFDGVEVSARMGHFTAGAIGGGQPDYRSSSPDPYRRKLAAFVNYRVGTDPFARNNITFAYGRQYYHGTLDREFVYAQASINPGSRLLLYQSAEIDLQGLKSGQPTHGARLTNTFVTLSWMPLDWVSMNAGYDATRPILLLESMKTISDTLLDRDLQQGFRASTSIRLPARLTVTALGGLRLKTEFARQAYSYGGGLRAADLFGSGLNAAAQYIRTGAVYTEGNDMTIDVDRWVGRVMSVSARLNRYAYTLLQDGSNAVATTASLAFTVRIAGAWYVVTNLDRVWDPNRDSIRMLAEMGYQF